MPVFSEAEFQEFDAVMKSSAEDVKQGKRPQISAVLMSLQFATTMPNEKGKMWFEDFTATTLICMSIKKLMDDNLPEMFSVSEKAYMFAILNTGRLIAAINDKGFNVAGFNNNSPPTNDDGQEEEDQGWVPDLDED